MEHRRWSKLADYTGDSTSPSQAYWIENRRFAVVSLFSLFHSGIVLRQNEKYTWQPQGYTVRDKDEQMESNA